MVYGGVCEHHRTVGALFHTSQGGCSAQSGSGSGLWDPPWGSYRVLPRGGCRLHPAVREVGPDLRTDRPGPETDRHSQCGWFLRAPALGSGGVAQHVASQEEGKAPPPRMARPDGTVSHAWRAGSRATPSGPWGLPCQAGSCSRGVLPGCLGMMHWE